MSTDSFKERFLFQSEGAPEKAFRVVRFSGREGLNILYRFEITLASQSRPDLDKVLASPAKLTILRDGGSHAVFHGYPTLCAQNGHSNGWTFYTLVLQPAFWKTANVVMNQIFLDNDVKEILEETLKKNGAFESEHAFKLNGSYPKLDFSMQYNESVYDYMAFQMEKNGIYYYFDQQSSGEKLIFADSKDAHAKLPQTPSLRYSPVSGLENAHREELVASFSLNQTPLPKAVFVRDHDWKRPGQAVEASAPVNPKGLGSVYYYGDGFSTEAEGKRIAGIRAEELICRAKVFTGSGSVPTMRPGFTFSLQGHYDDGFNRDYTITEVTHEGSQEGFLSLALGIELEHPSDKLYYRNSFACIPADVQFRPARVTERKKISGALTAFIDAASNTGVAESDEHGRYKVVFPLDPSGRGSGKASCWIRRMQPYVGSGYGSSFPLSPGVEVFVSFLDGDPDRPFIAGAVANPETGSTDGGSNPMLAGLTTNGGNGLIFNDKPEKQGLFLGSGGKRSGLFMASGSLDGSFLKSDTSLHMATASNTAMAGLASAFESGMTNMIRTSGGALPWYKMAIPFVKALEDITKGGLKADPKGEKDAYENWSQAAYAIKWLSIAASLGVDIKQGTMTATKGTPYATAISATGGSSMISQISQMTSGRMAEMVSSITAHLLTTIGQGILQQTVQEKSQKEQEDYDKLTEFQKKDLQRNYVVTGAKELVSEISPLLTLALKRDSAWNVRGVKFGGLKIDTPESNVTISSKTETRVSSANQTVIQAMPGNAKRVEELGANKLPDVYNKVTMRNKAKIILHSEDIDNLAQNSIKSSSCGSIQMLALDAMYLSNNPELVKPAAEFFSEEGPKYLDNAEAGRKSTLEQLPSRVESRMSSNNEKGYSQIEMWKAKLTLLNAGKELHILQNIADDSAVMDFKRHKEDNEINSLSFTKAGDVLSFKKDGSGKPRVVELLEGKAAISADKTAMTAEDKKITLAAEGAPQFTLEKDKAVLKTKAIEQDADEITLKSPAIKVGKSSFKNEKILLDAPTVELTGNMIKIG